MANAKKWQIGFLVSLAAIAVLFAVFQGPHEMGDTSSYVQAVQVLESGQAQGGFVPNRLITTFLGLEILRIGDIFVTWFVLNLILYLASCIVFFKLLEKMFGSRAAFLGGLFLAANYGYLLFGLNYLMDIGGWAFYIFALYFLLDRRYVWAAVMVGIGGLFKEYAFLGGVAIIAFILVELLSQKTIEKPKNESNFDSKPQAVWKDVCLAIIIMALPTVLLHLYVYSKFGYTYLDWLGFNAGYYTYSSRIVEYIKSLGSLLNLLGLALLGGLWVMVREWKTVGREVKVFLLSVLISFLPIFFWPAITQRILTIMVPFVILVSCFLFKKYENSRVAVPIFVIALALYVLATFFMDSHILNAVSVPL